MGADIVIASVLNYSFINELTANKKGINDLRYIENLMRTIKVMIVTLTDANIKDADIPIIPKIKGGPLIEKHRNILQDVSLGYKETLKFIPQIQNLLKR